VTIRPESHAQFERKKMEILGHIGKALEKTQPVQYMWTDRKEGRGKNPTTVTFTVGPAKKALAFHEIPEVDAALAAALERHKIKYDDNGWRHEKNI